MHLLSGSESVFDDEVLDSKLGRETTWEVEFDFKWMDVTRCTYCRNSCAGTRCHASQGDCRDMCGCLPWTHSEMITHLHHALGYGIFCCLVITLNGDS
jgi:hypothetical protein